MAELNRDFTKAKMNKDLDERLVGAGEYRDALNIEISTSEHSDAGTVQGVMGNSSRKNIDAPNYSSSPTSIGPHYDIPDTATCVGSVAAPNKDKVYYFISAGESNNIIDDQPKLKKDYIMEYNSVNERLKYVFVDIYEVEVVTWVSNSINTENQWSVRIPLSTTDYQSIDANGEINNADDIINASGIRPGMILVSGGHTLEDNIRVLRVTLELVNAGLANEQYVFRVWFDKDISAYTIPGEQSIRFYAPERVLNFNKNTIITGINVLDDFIFWTDDEHEPKKINIPRCIAGTGGLTALNGQNLATTSSGSEGDPNSSTFIGDTAYFHTRVVTELDGVLEIAVENYSPLFNSNLTYSNPVYMEEPHVTVIKKCPKTPPKLELYRTTIPRFPSESIIENDMTGFIPELDLFSGSGLAQPGNNVFINLQDGRDYRVGDVLVLNVSDANPGFVTDDNYALRVEVLPHPDIDGSPDSNPNVYETEFFVEILSIRNSLPTSATAFFVNLEQGESLFEFKFPRFSYRYKYQDGEYSTFAPWSEIAFLPDAYEFSAKQGFNLGMSNQVRNIVVKNYHAGDKRLMEDVVEIDILYKETNNPTVYVVETVTKKDNHPAWPEEGEVIDYVHEGRGFLEIKTDLIHTVLPSNQLLRPYDNVPRKALGQEISANRLIYGNYVQGFEINTPGVTASLFSEKENKPFPSVKTLRNYTVGVVFYDRYGRETPVLYKRGDKASVSVSKNNSDMRNRIVARVDPLGFEIPSWAEYFSYYIKEPTVEYYNMVMDRWYNAADGNVWISFPSSERNKVIEGDILILKKRNGNNTAVKGKSRYKVLAISDSAPDYVKTQRDQVARIFADNTDSNTFYIGSTEEGFPIADAIFFTVDSAQISAELGDDFVEQANNVKKYSARFVGGGYRSKIYDITRVAADIESGKDIFHIRGKFGSDVDWATDFTGSAQNAVDDISVIIYQNEVENLPEYDGRFFVKINRDDQLELAMIPVLNNVFVKQSHPVAYINNNGYRNHLGPGYQMPDDPRTINRYSNPTAFPDFTAQNLGLHPTERPYHHDNGGTNASPYYWLGTTQNAMVNPLYINMPGTWSSPMLQDSPGPEFWFEFAEKRQFFIDGATAYSWTSWNPHPMYGSNNYFENIFASSADAWAANNWYTFDQAPAEAENAPFYWDGPEFQEDLWYKAVAGEDFGRNCHTIYGSHAPHQSVFVQGQGTSNYPYWHMLNTNPIPHTWELWPESGEDGIDSTFYQEAVGPFNQLASTQLGPGVAASMRPNGGLPSRAIRDAFYWDNGIGYEASYMDISWTGMGSPQYDFSGTQTAVDDIEDILNNGEHVHHTLSNATSDGPFNFNEAWEFISTLITPGCRWRFQNDPDEIIYTTKDYGPTPEGWLQPDSPHWKPGVWREQGAFGIRNFINMVQEGQYSGGADDGVSDGAHIYALQQMYPYAMRQRWSLVTIPRIGSGPSGYNPIFGTHDPNEFADAPTYSDANYRRALHHDGTDNDVIEILDVFNEEDGSNFTPDGAIFEVQPRESVELDIYYQASSIMPITITEENNEMMVPLGSKFYIAYTNSTSATDYNFLWSEHIVTAWDDAETIRFTPALPNNVANPSGFISVGGSDWNLGSAIKFHVGNNQIVNLAALDSVTTNNGTYILNGVAQVGSCTTLRVVGSETSIADVNPLLRPMFRTTVLGWNNCWSFMNGVESDRIRDDFNAAQMDNGVKASSTVEGGSREERRKHGLIWSGIYNSVAGVNETNQFIAAERITKDINPIYGSIQKLFSRNTKLLIFCEDKILKAVTNRDALYNADGQPQLVASDAVIGDVTAYQGDYGISTNPESFAANPYRIYFSDVTRGQVLQLTTEGVTPISLKGMRDHFSDLFSKEVWKVVGSYDERKREYNISTLKKKFDKDIEYSGSTVSYCEAAGGWSSFKSFVPQQGVSINNSYYTFFDGHIWKHDANNVRGFFYGISATTSTDTSNSTTVILDQANSDIEVGMIISYKYFDGVVTVAGINGTILTLSSPQSINVSGGTHTLSFRFPCSITAVFNDKSNAVKSFGSFAYEGSDGKIPQFTDVDSVNMLNGVYSSNDGITVTNNVTGARADGRATLDHEYYNLTGSGGWYIDNVTTDLQSSGNIYFKEKEGKWFGYPCGESTSLKNLDEKEFTVQGLGTASFAHSDASTGESVTITIGANHPPDWGSSQPGALGDIKWDEKK
jgi:hypothetical protein